LIRRTTQGKNHRNEPVNLRLETLEARHLLAADIFAAQTTIVDPFAKDAVTVEQVIQRASEQDFVPGELLVALETEVTNSQVHTVLEPTWQTFLDQPLTAPAKTLMDFPTSETKSFQLVHIQLGADSDVVTTIERLDAAGDVLWSQPNFIHQGADPREYAPNDPQFANQYHHALIGNDVAWDVTFGDSEIVIGITDDGVDIQHQDLAASIWTNPGETPNDGIDNDGNGYIDDVNGYNFLNNNNNPDATPGNDHGTHVAGIAAGITDNGIGIAGTASGATIMPLKWYGGGTWTAAIIAETFTYAADMGANIVNTSYNMDGWAGDAVVHAAFDYMYDAGVLHFNSAGNGDSLNPARQVFEQTLLVASTDNSDIRSDFSNYGDGIDISSPGSGILSTTPGNTYDVFSGTSMASPNAAGVAALIWSAHPDWSRAQVVTQLMSTASDIDGLNAAYANLLGKGRVNSGAGVSDTVAAPQVASVTNVPASGVATATDMIQDFYVVYDQFMDAASVTNASTYELRSSGLDGDFDSPDDQVFSLTVGSEYRVGTNGIQVDIDGGPLGIGEYRLSIVSGGAENPFGTALDGNADGTGGDNYQAFFVISIEPFVGTGVLAGLGSVSANNPGSLGGVTDVDAYNFFVEAGERITAVVQPADPAATLTAEFVGIGGPVTASAPGKAVLIPLSDVDTTGDVSLSVTGDIATSYTFDIYRNVNIEDLDNVNDDAVDIEDSYLSLGSGRYAAIGQSNGLIAGRQFLQSNNPSLFIDISSMGTALGLGDDSEATITTTVGNAAFPAGSVTVANNGGIIAAASEDLATSNTNLPSASWTTALLPLWDDIDSDTGNVYWQETQVAGINTLIVQWNDRPRFSNIGDATFQVQVFETGPVLARFAYQDVVYGDASYDFGASATVGYQQDTSSATVYSVDTPSLANGDVLDLIDTASFDDIEKFTFEADAGSTIDVIVAGISRSLNGETIELLDPADTVVATASTAPLGISLVNADQAITDYVVQTSGTHTVRITTSQTATYSVVVTEDLTFDLESNNSIAAATRSLDATEAALGFIAGGTVSHSQYNDAGQFVDISGTGTALGLSDDGEAIVSTTVGNGLFPAGSITIGNNGAIIAQPGAQVDYSNGSLPDANWNTALLPFWDDIDATNGNVYWEETLVNGINTLIVQWHERPHYDDSGAATFQVQVFETGPIVARFAYEDVIFGDANDNGGGATIGVQVDSGDAYTISQDSASVFNGDVIDIIVQEDDIFALTLDSGGSVVVNTSTPFDNPSNVPVNSLDPIVAILDADGNVLASDASSASDGKNVELPFTADSAGTYYVSVSAEGGSGSYLLSLNSATTVDGDFNDDGFYDCLDIDALTVAVVAGANDAAFDLTGDGLVNLADRDAWLVAAGAANGLPGPYLLGDVDLDGTNDGADFVVWNAHKFTDTAAYCSGDMNMDGTVDGADFVLWNATKFQSSTVVPTLDPTGSDVESDTVNTNAMHTASNELTTPALPRRVDAAFANYDGTTRREDRRDAANQQREQGVVEWLDLLS
jgi:subtilisin family serine protease